MVEQLYPFLIVVGISVLLAAWYFARLGRLTLDVVSALFRIGQSAQKQSGLFFERIQEPLRRLGVERVCYRIDFMHSTLQNVGDPAELDTPLTHRIDEEHFHGVIALHVRHNRGEMRLVNRIVLNVIALQAVNMLHANVQSLHESFARLSKLQTFMLHDLKNILQFFQAMGYNLQHIADAQACCDFVETLRQSALPLDRKVQKILGMLEAPHAPERLRCEQSIAVAPVAKEYADFYQLPCTVKGQAHTTVCHEHLQTLFDTLMSNLFDKAQREQGIACRVDIEDLPDAVRIVVADDGTPIVEPGRAAEPFYTTKTEGIGIGLYQLSVLIDSLDGSFDISNDAGHPRFEITLPHRM